MLHLLHIDHSGDPRHFDRLHFVSRLTIRVRVRVRVRRFDVLHGLLEAIPNPNPKPNPNPNPNPNPSPCPNPNPNPSPNQAEAEEEEGASAQLFLQEVAILQMQAEGWKAEWSIAMQESD